MSAERWHHGTLSESLHAATHAALDRLAAENFPQRLWDHDATLWKQEPEHQKIIRNSLGWLTSPDTLLGQIDGLGHFAQEVKNAGFTHQVLLGMGGSSLCPDVCRATFGTAPGFLPLEVLDSTVPASVMAVEKSIDLAHTLFIVSSKSGGTTETLSFFEYFYDRVRSVKGDRAGENFIAITDPGTSLEKLAREKNFRRIFPGQPDIGGRYSALSNFGIVPAVLAGDNARGLLERAARLANACGPQVPAAENPGLFLGSALAEAAKMGHDKVTFVISPGICAFADWIEQLIAESTGKEGKGLLPVAGEPLGDPAVYGPDRVFVQISLIGNTDDATEHKLRVLESAGHPAIRIALQDILDMGAEFFRWEVATAAVGALLGIDAFDQPNVQESKDNTKRLLNEYQAQGKFAEENLLLESEGTKFFGNSALGSKSGGGASSAEEVLATFLKQARTGDYVALMAYIQPTREKTLALESLRVRLRDSLRLATTLGYGPRFLHSTGQLHKGGANNGLFIQITADDAEDLPIPGAPYTFSVLKQAQALGDMYSLVSKQRRVLRIHLGKDVHAGLARIDRMLQDAAKPASQAQAS
jgi:glucose-6-phosphate isomerase